MTPEKKKYWQDRIEVVIRRVKEDLGEANQYLRFIGEDKELIIKYRNIKKEITK